ncbi:MAG: putative acetyltransferase [Pedosphaera sp.]|nr:putative acetyltransferase [Pedosphaera sp.]
MNIRKAVSGDASLITDFNLRLAQESEALQLDSNTVTQGVATLLKDPSKGIYFVAELPEGGVVGQLMITYEWSDWRNGNIWWIQSVYVKEEFRGFGVFKALFDHVERLARDSQEVCALRLYMDKHNDKARRAYRKMGMLEGGYVVFEKGLTGGTGD